jgi:hypothetical protein
MEGRLGGGDGGSRGVAHVASLLPGSAPCRGSSNNHERWGLVFLMARWTSLRAHRLAVTVLLLYGESVGAAALALLVWGVHDSAFARWT